MPLTRNNMSVALPDAILGIFNKLHAHRFDLQKRVNKQTKLTDFFKKEKKSKGNALQ